MADEYVVASLPPPCPRPGQRPRGQLHRRRAHTQPASPTRQPHRRAHHRQRTTPALIGSFAIEVLQSIAAPATRRRQTIVVC
jgi:hypothetical protein